MRVKLLILLGLCGAGLLACGDDAESAGPPVSVGGDAGRRDGGGYTPPIFIGTGGRDGGGSTSGGDEDGGQDMGEVATRCRDVDPAPLDGADRDPTMVYNGVFTPTDLSVTRSEASWLAGCVQPTLRVTISDGPCPRGLGHELSFYIPADGVESSNVVIGQNLIMEETASSLRVRYTRPSRIRPTGTWGTCDGASGTLDVIGPIVLERGRLLQAEFTMELTRCDDGEPSVQTVMGSFSAEIPASLDDVCP